MKCVETHAYTQSSLLGVNINVHIYAHYQRIASHLTSSFGLDAVLLWCKCNLTPRLCTCTFIWALFCLGWCTSCAPCSKWLEVQEGGVSYYGQVYCVYIIAMPSVRLPACLATCLATCLPSYLTVPPRACSAFAACQPACQPACLSTQLTVCAHKCFTLVAACCPCMLLAAGVSGLWNC